MPVIRPLTVLNLLCFKKKKKGIITYCLYFYWSWCWRRIVTSISTPTTPEVATLGTMGMGIKDLDLEKGLPLRMLAT